MNLDEMTVADLMTREVMTIERNEHLRSVDDVMRLGRIRHLPVLDEAGRLVGVVSQRDLFHNAVLKAIGYGSHGMDKLLELLRVKEAMVTDVTTVPPDMPLRDAARIMIEDRIGCLPVVEDDKLVGILTETDMARLIAGS